jgi:hypothetical protein
VYPANSDGTGKSTRKCWITPQGSKVEERVVDILRREALPAKEQQ